MDLRALGRSLDEARLKLQPPPPTTGKPIHHLGDLGHRNNYATPTVFSSRHSSRSATDLSSDTGRVLKERSLNQQRVVRAPSPGRLKQLSQDKTQFFLEMERKKQEEERRALSLSRTRWVTSETQAMNAVQRLYEEAEQREKRLARLRLEEHQREKIENLQPVPALLCTSLSCSTISAPRTPLHERADSIVRQREENLSKIRASLESQEHQKNRQHKTVDPQQVTERLLQEAVALERKREQERLILLELEKPKGTPQINDHSRRIFEEKQRERRLSFVDRQSQELREREQRLVARQAEEAAKTNVRVTKVLSPTSTKKTIHRLAEEDAQKLKERRESIEQEYMSRFKFAPQIDERSKALAPKGSGGIENLYKNESAVQKKQNLVETIEQERMKECTFHPMILSTMTWAKQQDLDERRQKREEERQERLRQAKWELEMKEVNECTFRPLVNPSPTLGRLSDPAGRLIKGMDQYLERKRQAEEMKELQREREEKVFMRKLPPLTRRYTVARPFNLSG